jgi:UrcA family protein
MNAIIAKSIVAVSFAAALAADSAATHAAEPAVRSIIVRYAELDLSKRQGIEILYERIRGAAKRVCRPDSGALAIHDRASWRDCYQDAIERAVKQVNVPTLTALHRTKTSSAVG